jgi:hypothetical protein
MKYNSQKLQDGGSIRANIERQKFLKTNPIFQQPPSNARNPVLGNILGQGADFMNYATGTIGKFGTNLPADIVNIVSPKIASVMGKVPFGLIAPTSKEE